jgi:hypothetical protein
MRQIHSNTYEAHRKASMRYRFIAAAVAAIAIPVATVATGVVTGGSALAATPYSISFSSSGAGDTAGWTSAADQTVTLHVENIAPDSEAAVQIDGIVSGSTAPTTAPSFASSSPYVSGSGDPRLEIQAANLADSVAADITVYPNMMNGVTTGECFGTAAVIDGVCFFQNNTGEATWADVQTYLDANGGVKQAYLVQDAGSASVNNPYNAVITALSWDGQALIPAPHSVPNVVGERANPALAALQAAGLTGATSPARNPQFVYVVTAESPAAGTKVAPGTLVTLTVAKATASVTVPKVIGQRANPGLATIRAAGLVAVTNPLRKSTGTYVITSESPAAGSKVTPGAKIVVGVKLIS